MLQFFNTSRPRNLALLIQRLDTDLSGSDITCETAIKKSAAD